VAHSLADRLERDNPRFDRHRFLKAAGATSERRAIAGDPIRLAAE
jgi:hypothetical protein